MTNPGSEDAAVGFEPLRPKLMRVAYRMLVLWPTPEALYEIFRNGLIHEGRIKAGAQFSYDIESTVDEPQGILVINPMRLGHEVERALQICVAEPVRIAKRPTSSDLPGPPKQ